MDNETMITLRNTLAIYRRQQDEALGSIETLKQEMSNSPLGQALSLQESALAGIKKRAAECEAQLRDMAVSQYNATGDKTPCDGVNIRVMKRLEYDEAEAVSWAKTNAPVLVLQVLDKKGFETLCPETLVTVIEMPTATIARNLGPLVGESTIRAVE